jgi:pimeloyl-ACP methyl ester carboxylesterase
VRAELEGDIYDKSLITADLVARKLQLSLGKNFEAAARRRKAREPWSDAAPVWERLREISVPLLLLFGDRDRDSIAQRAHTFKQHQPDIDIRLVENAAHLLMWDNPDAFTASVLEWLASW